MEGLNRITAVASTTFRETIRNKILLHLFGFAAAMLALGWIISNWSLGEPGKIITDVGLTVTTLAGVAIALFSGTVLVWGEVDRKTILPILAKPLPRSEFVLGKFFGFGSAVTFVYLGMNALLLLLLWIVGVPISGGHFAAIYLSLWEVLVVVVISLLFSSFSSPTMSALFTIMIFVSGRFSSDIQVFVERNPSSSSRPVLEAIYSILPHLGSFDLRLEAVHNLPITFERLLYPTLYGVCYCVVILAVTVLVFRKRDLA